mmetsp:Transcript_42726/g.120753  ORF Transcript_42726/g.120753 Transcript_42726/m.120753 type:complete len:117 (-) Transcript_42726:763-1113(-)
MLTRMIDRHGVDTINYIASEMNFFGCISGNALVAEFGSIDACIDVGIDKNGQIQIVFDGFPSILIMEQIQAFDDDDTMVLSIKRVRIRFGIPSGMIKARHTDLGVVSKTNPFEGLL